MKIIRVASPDSVNEVQADTGFCCQSKNLVESVSLLLLYCCFTSTVNI